MQADTTGQKGASDRRYTPWGVRREPRRRCEQHRARRTELVPGDGYAETIMTTLGPATYRRARYRNSASGTSLVLADQNLGLIEDYHTRPAAPLGLMMMGHCTPREAEEFFAKVGGMTPSVSTLQRLTQSMHERRESIVRETQADIRESQDIPPDAVTASVSLEGVMVALRACEDGPSGSMLARGLLRHGLLPRHRGPTAEDPLSRLYPVSGKVTLKVQTVSEVAHIRHMRPEIRIGAVADGVPDNFSFLKSLPAETEVSDF